MRLWRARTRTRRLPATLPLACHDAVLGGPRTRVREEASGTGSGALVLANVFWIMCSGASADNDCLAALDMQFRKRSVGENVRYRRGQWSWLPSSPLPPSPLPASGRGCDPRRYHRHQRHPITGGIVYGLWSCLLCWGPCLVFIRSCLDVSWCSFFIICGAALLSLASSAPASSSSGPGMYHHISAAGP